MQLPVAPCVCASDLGCAAGGCYCGQQLYYCPLCAQGGYIHCPINIFFTNTMMSDYSVLQCVAVRCSVLYCAAVSYSVKQRVATLPDTSSARHVGEPQLPTKKPPTTTAHRSVLQYVVVRCRMLQCVTALARTSSARHVGEPQLYRCHPSGGPERLESAEVKPALPFFAAHQLEEGDRELPNGLVA